MEKLTQDILRSLTKQKETYRMRTRYMALHLSQK